MPNTYTIPTPLQNPQPPAQKHTKKSPNEPITVVPFIRDITNLIPTHSV